MEREREAWTLSFRDFFEGNAWNEMRWCQCKMVWRCHTTRHWFDYNHQSSREAKKSSEKNIKKTHAHKHFYFVRKLMDVCAWRMYIRSNKWNWNTRWRNVEKLTVLKCWPHKNIFTLKGRAYFTCFFCRLTFNFNLYTLGDMPSILDDDDAMNISAQTEKWWMVWWSALQTQNSSSRVSWTSEQRLDFSSFPQKKILFTNSTFILF